MSNQKNHKISLSIADKFSMLRGAINPDYFYEKTRPRLYKRCDNDPETVHDVVLESQHNNAWASKLLSPFFKPPENLKIYVNGIPLVPFGTAAGMDKNGEAIATFGNLFGFQVQGTVIIPQRAGNERIRMAVIEDQLDLLNAQGFPSNGLAHFYANISKYRKSGGKARIYASICGLPLSEGNAVKTAMTEMEILVKTLRPYVDGFVWNPYSPNTAALKLLREPSIFFETARMMEEHAFEKLRLVKIGPYGDTEKDATLTLVARFLEGGGHGAVTTNTMMVPKEKLPGTLKYKWGYQSAGRSGTYLSPYRQRSVMDLRQSFPESIIVATGGIFTVEDAYDTFRRGADMIKGYTPYAYFGPGLLRVLMKGVSKNLERDGFTLKNLQSEVRLQARRGQLESFLRSS